MKMNKKKIKTSTILIYAFLVFMVILYIAPLLWIVISSLKVRAEIIKNPFGFPEVPQWENFSFAWVKGKMGRSMLNSLIVCTTTLVVTMFLGSMAGFGIGRMKWKLSGLAMLYIMIGLMIPIHCVLIPLYVRFSNYKLTNSLFGLVIPYVTFSLPVSVFIMSGFFKSIPNELMESACIDGCSIYRMFFRIALPLSRTGLFVTGLMTFINNWNELLLAMIFLMDDIKKTMPVSLTRFVSPYETNYPQMFAAIVLAIIPSIVVYSMFSNQIVDGLTTGAVKG